MLVHQLFKKNHTYIKYYNLLKKIKAYTAIAYYITKHSTFPNKVISFSSRPDLITINKEGSSYVRYAPYGVSNDFCMELNSMYTGDCSNTDLGAVMRLLQNVNPKIFLNI